VPKVRQTLAKPMSKPKPRRAGLFRQAAKTTPKKPSSSSLMFHQSAAHWINI